MNVVLCSGGIDSSVLLHMIHHWSPGPLPLAFDYGQPHRRELESAAAVCASLGLELTTITIGADWLGETIDGLVFPNRNTIFASIAGAFAMKHGARAVWMGVHAGDYTDFPDCRPEWVAAMDRTLAAATEQRIRLGAPFVDVSKRKIVEIGRDMEVPFELTWSCYGTGPEPCGTCLACRSRAEALA